MLIMVIMVTNTTSDEPMNDDDEMRLRMRKRFHEMDERRRKEREARMAWPFVMWFGLMIIVLGLVLGLLGLGIITLSWQLLLSTGIIIFGMLLVAVGLFLKNNPEMAAKDE
jgi:purine-cytosine permease-like protein